MTVVAVLCLAVPLTISTLHSPAEPTTTQTQASASTQLFRSINSRGQAWGQAVDYIRAKPFTGYGIGNEQGQPADAILKSLEELGLFAVFPLLLLVADSFEIFRQREDLLKPVFVVLLVEGLFESWLFALGNPFFLVFLAVSLGLATQRPRRTNGVQPAPLAKSLPFMGGPEEPRGRSGESNPRLVHKVRLQTLAAITAPPPPAAQVQAIDTSAIASSRRGAATLVDQACSSLQNYLILIIALRSFDLVNFGEFSIAYTVMFFVVNFVRALVLEPFTIRFTTASPQERRRVGRDATGASIATGIILGCVCIAGALIAPAGPTRVLLIAYGVALPIMLLQDAWRMILFASGRPWLAAINDASCLLTTAALVAAASLLMKPSPGLLIAIWAAGDGRRSSSRRGTDTNTSPLEWKRSLVARY